MLNENFMAMVLGECESIISETENIQDLAENDGFMVETRIVAEELQDCIMSGDIDKVVGLSIELYQNAKYESEDLDLDNSEVYACVQNMLESVNAIRANVR